MFLETIEEEDESAIESCWTPIIAYMWSLFDFDFESRSLVF